MKKLLVLAAVVVASVAANAASFKWSAGNIYASNGTDKYTGSVVLYAYLSDASGSTDNIASAIAVSTVTASSAGAVAATTFSSDSLEGGNYYNFFFTATETVGGTEYTFTSGPVTKAAYATQTQTIAFGNMSTATLASGAWVAAPEPTSGLLMLLGMAGLALRRRRA